MRNSNVLPRKLRKTLSNIEFSFRNKVAELLSFRKCVKKKGLVWETVKNLKTKQSFRLIYVFTLSPEVKTKTKTLCPKIEKV